MRTALSFVIDDHPKFLMQAWNLVHSLIASGTCPSPCVELLVHHTSQVDRRRLKDLAKLGAKLIEIESFGTGRAVYCNKLRQLESAAVLAADKVVLLDADVMPLSSLARLFAPGISVQAKIVDAPNPPEPVWRALLTVAGLDPDDVATAQPSLHPTQRTIETNCNGGLYVLSNDAVRRLGCLWPKWARFCLQQDEVLGRWIHHADQLGFTLAMTEANLDFRPLELADNFPTHFPAHLYEKVPERNIRLIHYHDRMDGDGLPALSGISWVDSQIVPMNDKIRELRRSGFDVRVLSDFRDVQAPLPDGSAGSPGNKG